MTVKYCNYCSKNGITRDANVIIGDSDNMCTEHFDFFKKAGKEDIARIKEIEVRENITMTVDEAIRRGEKKLKESKAI